jgi:hypothetical protein
MNPVKVRSRAVKEPSRTAIDAVEAVSLRIVPSADCAATAPERWGRRLASQVNGDEMSVLLYVVLTVVIFALLGLVQRLVERL